MEWLVHGKSSIHGQKQKCEIRFRTKLTNENQRKNPHKMNSTNCKSERQKYGKRVHAEKEQLEQTNAININFCHFLFSPAFPDHKFAAPSALILFFLIEFSCLFYVSTA